MRRRTDQRSCDCFRDGVFAVTAAWLAMMFGAGESVAGQTGGIPSLSAGPVRVDVHPYSVGVTIAVDGVVVSTGSELSVAAPCGTPLYYVGPHGDVVKSATREQLTNGERLVMTHRGAAGEFEATDTITVTNDRRVVREWVARYTGDHDAWIKWQAAGINPSLIIGRTYFSKDMSKSESTIGSVPIAPVAPDPESKPLASGFAEIRFDSRIGSITVRSDSDRPLVCVDQRKHATADPRKPMFWLGDPGSRIQSGQTARYRLTFELPPPVKLEIAPPICITPAITDRPDSQRFSLDTPPIIIPRPKQIRWRRETCDISGWLSATAETNPMHPPADLPDARDAANLLSECVNQRFGLSPTETTPRSDPWVTPSVSWGRSAKSQPREQLELGGYALSVRPESITVSARNRDGYLNAIQTLRQLAAVGPKGELLLRCVDIRDWPSLEFRGVHLFTGGQGPQLHELLIRDVIAACKLNRIVLESEYIEWDSYPEIHHPAYGMPKREVAGLLELAQGLGIEVIPLINSLGHCQWMFEGGHHLDLAEDPDARWAYCVTNPKTYEFIHNIYAEVIDLFQPRVLHIGHDEFHHQGRVPFRETSKPFSVEELFMKDTMWHHQWLTQRRIGMMMWGDMLLGPGEAPDACHAESTESAAKLRSQLPGDILIADWHYVDAPAAKFTSLAALKRDGYRPIASTWYRPGNIVQFARAAFDQKAAGLLQTTWAGFSLDRASFAANLDQYAAYVLAADAAWNADNPPDPDQLPYHDRFLEMMNLSSLERANASGWTVSLKEAYHQFRCALPNDDWFGMGWRHDLMEVPYGVTRLRGILFDLGFEGNPDVVALSGKLANKPLPESFEITINRRADRLAVAHAANFTSPAGTRIATMTIQLEDGSTESVDFVAGSTSFAHNDISGSPDAPAVWRGISMSGEPAAVRALVWKNPRPNQPIDRITFQSANNDASLMIFAVTGLTDTDSITK